MRVGIASIGMAVPFATRLESEGTSTLTWISTEARRDGEKTVGDGIIPKTTDYNELIEWCEEGQNNGEPVILLFDFSGLGEKADEARKRGLHVIGGSKFSDRMEKDRNFGFSLAEQMGADLPYYEVFSSLSSAISYASKLGDRATYFKPDRHISSDTTYGASSGHDMVEYLTSLKAGYGDRMKCIIQDKVEGVAISTENWFNGKEFVGPFTGIIEKKKMLNGDIGPSTGCSLNAMWFYEDTPDLAEMLQWENLAAILRKNEAPPGVYDANAIVTDSGEAYFLEWCGRFGYNSEPTGMCLINDYSSFLWYIATGTGFPPKYSKQLALSVQLWQPPYPFEGNLKEMSESRSCLGNHIFGIDSLYGIPFCGYGLRSCGDHYQIASTLGQVGLAISRHTKLSRANENCIDYAKTLRPSSIGYRTDADEAIAKDAKELMKVLSDLPKGLVE